MDLFSTTDKEDACVSDFFGEQGYPTTHVLHEQVTELLGRTGPPTPATKKSIATAAWYCMCCVIVRVELLRFWG